MPSTLWPSTDISSKLLLPGKTEGDRDDDPADGVVDDRRGEDHLPDVAAQEAHVAHHLATIFTEEIESAVPRNSDVIMRLSGRAEATRG